MLSLSVDFSSPPPEQHPSPQPTTAPAVGKKRKRGAQQPQHASSPAPSDPGTPEVLSSKSDLFTRPQLNVSRGPVFTPVADGSSYFKTELIGVNRVGFRYVPAGIKPPGSVIQFRTIESNPCSYRVSWEDRSPFIHVSKDGLGLLGTKGHRSARGNAPVREGKWYMEVKILRGGGDASTEGMREGCHVRLGWGRREAPLNGPVGLDGYSYGVRDKTGEKVTLSRPRPYARPFRSSDVIGMYISLPPKRAANPKDPSDPAHLNRERIAIDFKGQEMFEMQEYPQAKEMTALMDYSGKSSHASSLPSTSTKKFSGGKLPNRSNASTSTVQNKNADLPSNTYITWFPSRLRQNGKKATEKKKYREGLKESHKDNPFDDGTLGYYPFISLFNDASVQLNPGPDFEFPPPPDIDAILDDPNVIKADGQERTWRPMCERYLEFMAEQWEFDEREEQEAQSVMSELAAQEKAAAQKKAQRERKKRETEAKKRAKIQPKEKSPSIGPGSYALSQPQPSPLRHASVTAYEEPVPDAPSSPIPNPGDTPSRYHSDNGEEENGETVAQESGSAFLMLQPQRDDELPVTYGSPVT
ncbi:hypothetical protein BDP27DRAFT_1420499 [Rhodocollybia butyracea]|uniref:B30.2/SPRY domain-containing protein n=1 Tax=Rhodocollybia butyracea TaxID=206335 RepID=A0A9P5PVB4_9AGAR|nr:hypothetical protein BDP27DRAFT_1420499 [Rhodocollybia butyracea]